jgi:lysophospholipase L1-like esterase
MKLRHCIRGWLKRAGLGGLLFAVACCLLLPACGLPDRQKTAAPLKIVIVGDSTVANYPTTVPDRGWGQFIGEYFDDSVTVVNLARNGRSTKTFISEGLWQKALLERPNYVLIQFGHNDSHAPDRPEATSAATTFRDYLRQYIDESRAAGAVPILITPVQRRTYGPDGRLDNSLLPYAEAMKAVAREKNVSLIDLNASSGRLYERLGSKANAAVSRNGTDTTHFNERGARWMAQLVMRDLLIAKPELKSRIKPGSAVPQEVDLTNQ